MNDLERQMILQKALLQGNPALEGDVSAMASNMLLGMQQQNLAMNQYTLQQQQMAMQRQIVAATGTHQDASYNFDGRGNGAAFGRHAKRRKGGTRGRFARRSSANAPTANGPRTFANVAAGSLKESDLYKKVNGVPASSSPQAGFRQRPILPAYLADALGPENIALQREAGRLRAGSITRYGGGGDMDSDLPFEISDLDINEQPNPPQRFPRTNSQSALTSALTAAGLGLHNLDGDDYEGTPTTFSMAAAQASSSMKSVPEMMLPNSYSVPSPYGRKGLPIPSSPGSNMGGSYREGSSPISIGYRSQQYPTGSSWAPSSYQSSMGGAPSSVSSDEGLNALAAKYNASFPLPRAPTHQLEFLNDDKKKASLRGRDQMVVGLMTETAEDGCPIIKVPRLPVWGIDGTLTVPHRVWKKGGTEKADSRHFMVMSYNVLAPMYCTESRYSKSERKYLDWEYRRKKILDEIAFYAPDFVCLQELPPSDFKEVFLTELQKIGYDGHFQAKKKDHAADGCAIFYLESRFSLLAVQAFAYSDQINDDPNSDLASRLAPFPNIALVCVFQNRQARSLRVRVVNTHLHWDPAFADTKLLQAAILMEWLERTHREVPTVIAADLNSRAGEAVVDYLVRGKVAPGALFGDKDFGRFTASLVTRVAGGGVVPFSSLMGAGYGPLGSTNPADYSNSVPNMGGLSSSLPNGSGFPGMVGSAPNGMLPMAASSMPLLRHGTKLASAYDRKDLPFTNKTPDFEGSIDHILYTSGTLSIRDVLADLDPGPNGNQSQPVYPPSTLSPNPGYVSLDGQPIFTLNSDSSTTSPVVVPGTLDPDRLGAQNTDDSTTPRTASPSDVEGSPRPSRRGDGTDTAESLTPPASSSLLNQPSLQQSANPMSPNPHPQHHHHNGYFTRLPSLPTEFFPSDHIPLVAWLKWKTVPVGSGPSLGSSLGTSSGANPSGINPNGVELRPRPRGGRRGTGGGNNGNGGNPNMMGQGGSGSYGQIFTGSAAAAHLLSSSAPGGRSNMGMAHMNGAGLLASGLTGSTAMGHMNAGGGFDNRPPLPGSTASLLQLQHQLQQQQQQQQQQRGMMSPSAGMQGLGMRQGMNTGNAYFDPNGGGSAGRKFSLPGGLGSPQQMMGNQGMPPTAPRK